jgi:hypothetical protein
LAERYIQQKNPENNYVEQLMVMQLHCKFELNLTVNKPVIVIGHSQQRPSLLSGQISAALRE